MNYHITYKHVPGSGVAAHIIFKKNSPLNPNADCEDTKKIKCCVQSYVANIFNVKQAKEWVLVSLIASLSYYKILVNSLGSIIIQPLH